MRARALKDLGAYDDALSKVNPGAEGETSAYSFHMADQGTDAMEREKAFLFASKEGRYLYHLDQALRRIYKTPPTFGTCEECGKEILFERLDAIPHTRLCIACKEREENG
jgi:RNA polymerase-binding transcription factor DksA